MLSKIVLGIILGIGLVGWRAHDDPWIKQIVHEHIKNTFEASGNCRVSCTLESINFFIPKITLSNVVVMPPAGNEWQWCARTMNITFSWLHFIRFGFLHAYVECEQFDLTTRQNNGYAACLPHFNALYSAPAGPISVFLKEFLCKNSKILVTDSNTQQELELHFHSFGKKINEGLTTQVYLHDGHVQHPDLPSIKALQGIVHAHFSIQEGRIQAHGHTKLSYACAHLAPGSQKCVVEGAWDHDQGSLHIKTAQESTSIGPVSITKSDKGYTAVMTLDMLLDDAYRLIARNHPAQKIGGRAQGTLQVDYTEQGINLNGTITARDIAYNGTPLCSQATLLACKKGLRWEGSLNLDDKAMATTGTWFWHEDTQVGAFDSINRSTIAIPGTMHWNIQPYQGNVLFNYSGKDGQIRADYKVDVTNDLCKEQARVQGTATSDPVGFSIAGIINDITYDVHGKHSPSLVITKAYCCDSNKKTLLHIEQQEHDPSLLMGKIHMPLVQSFLLKQWGYEIQGEGIVDIAVAMRDDCAMKIHLDNGTIRLPGTYNFLTTFDGMLVLHIKKREIIAQNIRCNLHRGKVLCQQAKVLFNNDYQPTFIHAPILLSNCLLNVRKDLYALVSGRILFSKKEEELPQIKSSFIVEQSQLKENIFSQDFQRHLFTTASSAFMGPVQDITCDISLETKSPVFIKTPFLETRVYSNLRAQKTIGSPDISGDILFRSGTIMFPYKPLFITQGALHFSPHREPTIKLVAKNTIKKHMITLTVDGLVTAPHIMLESSPTLTEEQIIALLLAGTKQESLNAVMPALIIQNITSLLFGNEQSVTKLDHYFKTLVQPFKRVHIVPSFTDQKGRGGLRGAVEVDVNDRWRVLAQKNFSLSEDTRFEVEYAISDDIGVRGFRDERRDIGAEVEMKWKF